MPCVVAKNMNVRICFLIPCMLLGMVISPLQADEPGVYLAKVKPLLVSRCVECHGKDLQKADLRLDSFARLKAGGNSGESIVAGKPEDSLLIQAVTGTNGLARMPPKGPPLAEAEVGLLKDWISAGAPAPEKEDEDPANVRKTSPHWSFQPVQAVPPPMVIARDWPRSAIDHFILSKLEKEGIAPSAEADRLVLLRRVFLDLIGFPPSPEEVAEFLADQRPDAYERVVDKLLASPHYGERMARQWLDLARYADSNGFTRDQPRLIWKYRDWVIEAFNRDLPFDQFAIEQIAGDLLPNATLEQKIATGFHRNTLINEEGGTDPEQFRIESVVDRVNTTGAVFLGLTIGCAQCHDHKYDPFSQREYYQLFAFLNNCDEPRLEVPTAEQQREGAMEKRAEIRKKIAELEKEFATQKPAFEEKVTAWEKTVTEEQKQKLPILVTNTLNLSLSMRKPSDIATLHNYYRELPEARQAFPVLEQMYQLKKSEPVFITTMVLEERDKPRETFVHIRGDFLRHGAKVAPAIPEVLPPLPSAVTNPNRLDFARWLVSEDNPLTPRVVVNRLWMKFFGRGLVETENDFGTQGSPPTHPELLDWLASEFRNRGWSLKNIQREIVLSATYRQASTQRTDLESVDPLNKWWARQSRIRLDAEVIRDVALASSGLLSPVIGGPSVTPPQPAGVFDFTQDKKPWDAAKGSDRYRRGMYTYLWRSSPYPAMTVFDFPDANTTCTRRNRSNTPLQSLTLANDLTFLEFARGLAAKVWQQPDLPEEQRLKLIFQRAVARPPTVQELAALTKHLQQQRQAFEADTASAEKFGAEFRPASIAAVEFAAWTSVARVLINLDEFITRE